MDEITSSRQSPARRSRARGGSRSSTSSPSGPRDVGRLAAEIGVSQPNVSQHLAVMRAAGLVEAQRHGREIRYRLADPDVIVACDVMRGVLQRRLARLAGISARSARPTTRWPRIAARQHPKEITDGPNPSISCSSRGTDDKLQAAAVLTAGAAALGKPVNVFLQYWALDAFRRDRIDARPRRSRPRPAPRAAMHVDALRARRPGQLGGHPPPGQGPRRGRHPGLLAVHGPARTSTQADLDPLVDGVEGVTAFYLNAGEGQVVFI